MEFDATLGYPGEGPVSTGSADTIVLAPHGDFLLSQIAKAVREKYFGQTAVNQSGQTRDLNLERDAKNTGQTWNSKYLTTLLDPRKSNSLTFHGLVTKKSRGVYELTERGVTYVNKQMAGPSPSRKKQCQGKNDVASTGQAMSATHPATAVDAQSGATTAQPTLPTRVAVDLPPTSTTTRPQTVVRRLRFQGVDTPPVGERSDDTDDAAPPVTVEQPAAADPWAHLSLARGAAAAARKVSKLQSDLRNSRLACNRLAHQTTYEWDSMRRDGTLPQNPFADDDHSSFDQSVNEILVDLEAGTSDEDELGDAPPVAPESLAQSRRLARNIVCHLAVAAGFVTPNVLAGAGKVAHLLVLVFQRVRRLVPWALELFFASWRNATGSLDTYIVDRIRAAFTILEARSNRSEDDRRAYHVGATFVAPPLVGANERYRGKLKAVADRLGLKYEGKANKGKKSEKRKRLSALKQSQLRAVSEWESGPR